MNREPWNARHTSSISSSQRQGERAKVGTCEKESLNVEDSAVWLVFQLSLKSWIDGRMQSRGATNFRRKCTCSILGENVKLRKTRVVLETVNEFTGQAGRTLQSNANFVSFDPVFLYKPIQ